MSLGTVAGLQFTLGSPLLAADAKGSARGIVYDAGERAHPRRGQGIAGVKVSNGREVVVTDAQGRWELPVLDAPHTIFFVIQPRGWRVPVDALQIPRYFHIHCPKGSTHLKYGGLQPTGASLPAEIAFGLFRCEEPEEFKWLLIGDPQSRNEQQLRYLSHHLPEQLRNETADFGLVQGDVVWDRPNLFKPTAKLLAMGGKPMWYIFGNHDIDYDAPDNVQAADSYKQVFGPTYYAFDHGALHFIMLNSVIWEGGSAGGNYRGGIDPIQMTFIENDLKHVHPEQPVVIAMHIPLKSSTGTHERAIIMNGAELLRRFQRHNLIFATAGHRHLLQHFYLDRDFGWSGSKPLHHFTNAATCGTWWRGDPDVDGVPHATMRDGAPRGYTISHYRKGRVYLDFRATGAAAGHQIHIITDPADSDFGRLTQRTFYANVFMGCERTTVRFRVVGESDWMPMEQSFEPCPRYAALVERSKALKPPYSKLNNPEQSLHLWRAQLPENIPAGEHQLEVSATDSSERIHRASQWFAFNPA